MTSRTRTVLSLVVACLPLAMSAVEARADAVAVSSDQAQIDPELADGARLLTEAEAYQQDAEVIAAEQGRPVPEVLADLYFQQAVLDLVESLPADVVRSGAASGKFSFVPRRQVTLYFKGDVPDVVPQTVARAGIAEGEVRLQGGMRHSLEELTSRQAWVHDAVTSLGFDQKMSSIAVVSQTINVEVVQQADRVSLRGSSLRDAVLNAVNSRSALVADPVRPEDLVLTERPAGTRLVEPEHSYGGAWLRDDGVRECTSGFTVRRPSDQVEGTLTAAHCEGLNQMEENNTSGAAVVTFSAPFASEHLGWYGDVEWHTTSHDDYPQFWNAINTRRTVTSRVVNAGIFENAMVCKFGRGAGGPQDCGSVSRINISFSFYWTYLNDWVDVFNMVEARDVYSVGGDSGGPWFSGTTAWGIHHGTNPNNGLKLFSKIQNAELAFGVSVEFG